MKNFKFLASASRLGRQISNFKLRKFKICPASGGSAGADNLPTICNSRRDGFTLVELLIAITITAFALAGVYTSFVVQQRSFTTQDQVAEVDLTSKIAFDMIVNDIRAAGFGYPDGEDINGQTQAITIDDTGNPDTITFVGGLRQLTTLANSSSLPSNQIYITAYSTSNFNKTTRSNLNIGGLFFAKITNCTLSTGEDQYCLTSEPLTLDRDVKNRSDLTGEAVYLIEDITYQIDNDNNLKRGSDTIAENIEDLQFVDIDQDGDGVRDRIRISLLARTAHEDPTLEPSTKPYYTTGITLEGNTTPVNTDRYRRRIWSMEVGLRN